MDGSQSGQGANNSSDFVSLEEIRTRCHTDLCTGAQAIQVRVRLQRWFVMDTNHLRRMLESPQDESVVRWGNEGDSFVVLEACAGKAPIR